MIFASNSPCKSYENEQNPYFSDFECNFRLLGGVFHKCSKSKYHRFHQNNFFGTHFSCEKHPLHILIMRANMVTVTKKAQNDPNDKGDQEETLLVGKFGDIF